MNVTGNSGTYISVALMDLTAFMGQKETQVAK
jgi:hypothetical protein